MVTHYLKTWPEHYKDIVSGKKKAELRFNDRDFKVGDLLSLMEYNPETDQYTGSFVIVKVTHILEGGAFGLEKGFVMMSIEK
jgi:hypothetical protein